jgi:hypothetical protein
MSNLTLADIAPSIARAVDESDTVSNKVREARAVDQSDKVNNEREVASKGE